jgi:ABC-type multidrug transport system ATPase subunit
MTAKVTLTGETVAPRLALQVEDLHVSYGSKRAVDGVSLDINEGEIFGLLGPNGAGKTTTLSAIEGLLRPNAGSIRIGDVDARANPTAAKARMGVQLQSTSSNRISRSARSSDSTPACMAYCSPARE